MSTSPRVTCLFVSGFLLATLGIAGSSAQTPVSAPQLLPYTARLIAGSGTKAIAKGTGTCPVSGYNATDAYGDGCLATEIQLTVPKYAVADKTTGAVFFSDYTNGLIRRVDPVTGIVTAVAGGATASPSGTTATPKACGGTDTGSSTDSLGDGCLGTSVKLGRPTGLVFSPAGDLYFSDYYNYNVRKIAATGGVITGTGVISLAAGNPAGSKGFAANPATCTPAATATCIVAGSAASYLDAPYDVAFDASGNLYIAEEYFSSVLVVNTTAAATTVAGVVIPPGTIAKVVGARTATGNPAVPQPCINGTGTTTTTGCNYNNYTSGVIATSNYLDSPYSLTLDPANNIYVANGYYNDVPLINASTDILTNYAGIYPVSATGVKRANTYRGTAGMFAIGSDYGVTADLNSNLYITDALNGLVWRVDAATQSMYVVAGGGTTPPAANNPCPNAPNFIATDALGDGCPGLTATLSSSGATYATAGGVWGVKTDAYSDLFIGDENNNVIREIASGTQFGPVGASQTDYVDIHFAPNDGPSATNPYVITAGTAIFTLGTASCTTNTDNTTDCILPITAAPTATGPFSGTLTVYSNRVPLGTTFPLSGNYIQSPSTRLAVSYTTGATCSGTTTYATTTPVTITATLTANGPAPPVGAADTITFFANNGSGATQIGSAPVSNIGTASSPVYGAVLSNYTFSTPGTYTLTATYSGDSYFHASTGKSATTVSTATAAYTTAATAFTYPNVVAGETALYSFNVVQTVYTGTFTFACSGLPAGAACVFNPSTITATGCSSTATIALSITTTPPPIVQTGLGLAGPGPLTFWTLLGLLPCLALVLLLGMRRRSRFAQLGMVLALLFAASGLLACGNGVKGPAATPSGSYLIGVTTTSSTGGTSSFTVPLTVK